MRMVHSQVGLQAPGPVSCASLTPDPVPGTQPEAPVGVRCRGTLTTPLRKDGEQDRRPAPSPWTPGAPARRASAALPLALHFPGQRLEEAGAEICATGGQEGWKRRPPLPAPDTHS